MHIRNRSMTQTSHELALLFFFFFFTTLAIYLVPIYTASQRRGPFMNLSSLYKVWGWKFFICLASDPVKKFLNTWLCYKTFKQVNPANKNKKIPNRLMGIKDAKFFLFVSGLLWTNSLRQNFISYEIFLNKIEQKTKEIMVTSSRVASCATFDLQCCTIQP